MACSESFDERKAPFFSQRVNDILRNTNVYFTFCKIKMEIPYHRSGRLPSAQSPGNPQEIESLHTPTYA